MEPKTLLELARLYRADVADRIADLQNADDMGIEPDADQVAHWQTTLGWIDDAIAAATPTPLLDFVHDDNLGGLHAATGPRGDGDEACEYMIIPEDDDRPHTLYLCGAFESVRIARFADFDDAVALANMIE